MLNLRRCFLSSAASVMIRMGGFDTLFSCFLVSGWGEPGQPSSSAVNGFHMASSASCREVIRQHSITGGQNISSVRPRHSSCVQAFSFSVSSSRGGFHEEDGSPVKYHHLARLPSWLTMCFNREYEKILMSCGQNYLFHAFFP